MRKVYVVIGRTKTGGTHLEGVYSSFKKALMAKALRDCEAYNYTIKTEVLQ